MNKSIFLKSLVICVVVAVSACQSNSTDTHEKDASSSNPNIIFILTDDLGYGDLSCYGQEIISTPNIDQMSS